VYHLNDAHSKAADTESYMPITYDIQVTGILLVK